MKFILAAAFLAATSCIATAQTAPSAGPTFPERLAQAEIALRVGDSGFQGPGSGILAEAVARARYVLIGEAHFSQEIPRFTTALCLLMAPRGLRAMAVETGPEAVRIVNGVLRRPDRVARLSAFMRAHPDAMAFQNNAAESDMAAACARAAGPAFRLWGLDQEFFGASGFLLEEMAAAAQGRASKAAIARLQVLDRSATAAAMTSGSPGKLLIYTVTDAQMTAAQAAIATDGGARAAALFAQLAETRAIFLAANSGEGDPNGRRARLIKRTLRDYWRSVPGDSRILMKFGDVHVAKGVNALRQRDLGNFVAEHAEGEGASSLHILVLGAEGRLGAYNGFGRQTKIEQYAPTTSDSYPWLKEALAVRPASASPADWRVIDLRAFRAGPARDLPTAWRQLVVSYDLVVIAPRLTPAELLGVAP